MENFVKRERPLELWRALVVGVAGRQHGEIHGDGAVQVQHAHNQHHATEDDKSARKRKEKKTNLLWSCGRYLNLVPVLMEHNDKDCGCRLERDEDLRAVERPLLIVDPI